jgi:chromate reductase, NAD(P)H dehydrogenase (quinone)
MPSHHDVAVLVGSLRRDSLSLKLAKAMAGLGESRLTLRFIAIGDLPFYDSDLDIEPPPPAWARFRADVARASAVLFVTPEYNRSVPAALKNAIDVGSRPYGASVWSGKPAAIVSQSPGAIGGFGANHHLRQSLVFLDMPVLQQPEAYVGGAAQLFDERGELAVEGTRTLLKGSLATFADWIERTAERG